MPPFSLGKTTNREILSTAQCASARITTTLRNGRATQLLSPLGRESTPRTHMHLKKSPKATRSLLSTSSITITTGKFSLTLIPSSSFPLPPLLQHHSSAFYVAYAHSITPVAPQQPRPPLLPPRPRQMHHTRQPRTQRMPRLATPAP